MDRRKVFTIFVVLFGLFSASCSTSLFKVKPATELPPLPADSRNTEANGLTVTVAPLLTDEQTQELFEVNLPMTGVLAVRAQLQAPSGTPLELKRARFVVHDAQNREWKLLSPKQTVSRIMSANGMKLYNPNARKQFESEITSYSFDTKTPLDSTRSGFLFFQTPDKRAVDANQKLTLSIERLPQPVSIALN